MVEQMDDSASHGQLEVRQLIARLEQSQEEGQWAQELLQGLLSAINSSADAIIIYDLDGNAQYVSDSFTRLFGWTKEQVLGKHIPFMPESEREISLAHINRLIQEGTQFSGFETRRTTADGAVLDVNICIRGT
jgi:PAS domain S-box-containing protein